ncbi:alpha/beta hydrolase family protein [Streptomyces longisporoflavus]|uniref:Alpha/beta hydrolase family protein n=1 Tax=Streptomyces longisporoflavus TaxID=28044 RepID=A0ABW7QZZ3_9ACTN
MTDAAGKTLRAEAPIGGLRKQFVEEGYAWAASSFPTTGYDVGPGVKSSHDLAEFAATELLDHRPERTYITGGSMGGHVVARSLEEYPEYYGGALSLCGQVGDRRHFDYFLDANLAAQALSGVDAHPAGDEYMTKELPLIEERLGLTGLEPGGTPTTVAGRQFQQMYTELTGGPRPGADAALGMYGQAMLQTAPTWAAGPSVQNLSTRYEPTTPVDINGTVERVAPESWDERNSMELNDVPIVLGKPRVPVMSMHDTADMLVPLSMQQTYTKEVAANGRSDLLVNRAIRSATHCDFTDVELVRAWKDLTTWVEDREANGDEAVRPAGDDILDRKRVASAAFGCRFTDPVPPATPQFASRKLFPACSDDSTHGGR